MLSEEKNRLLTRVGPGTPMGALLRRYWQPFLAASDLDEEPTRAIRLLGEDLVVYKDLSGNYGLLERHCPHRRADLSYGYVEPAGLRCNYHGWVFAADGRCLEQPYQDAFDPEQRLRNKVGVRAYPVAEKAGLLWAYMGPQPAPCLPDWEPFSRRNGFRQIIYADVPCNWLQCQENSIDPVHFEWMHSNWSLRLGGTTGPYTPTHKRVGFEEFEYGFTYKRILESTSESDPLWTTGRVCLWPNGFFLGGHFEWRVPVDDENTLSLMWSFIRVPNEREPYVQERIPSWKSPIRDERTGRWISSHVINQDIIAWVGQGTIADRTRENLAASDRGIAMIRQRFFHDLDAIASGRDPKGLIRDPERNHCVPLPMIGRDLFYDGMSLDGYRKHPLYGRLLDDFRWHYGQPPAVRRAFREAMGLPRE